MDGEEYKAELRPVVKSIAGWLAESRHERGRSDLVVGAFVCS